MAKSDQKGNIGQGGSRPLLTIPVSKMEWLIEVFTVVLLLITLAIVVTFWNKLPASIPIHFGADGKSNNFAPQTIIGYLTGFNTALYGLLTFSSFFPHTFNYIWKITEENAARQYLLARQFLRVTKLEVTVLTFFATWTCIQIAIDPSRNVDSGDLITLVWVLVLTVLLYLWRSYMAR
ncbi:MAG TPA: DUF1648 domain-containing protein [Chroococcales cyanobacterium]